MSQESARTKMRNRNRQRAEDTIPSIQVEPAATDADGRQYHLVDVPLSNSNHGHYPAPLYWRQTTYYPDIIRSIHTIQFSAPAGSTSMSISDIHSYVNLYHNQSIETGRINKSLKRLIHHGYIEASGQPESYKLTDIGYTVASQPYAYMPSSYIVVMIMSQAHELTAHSRSHDALSELLLIASDRDPSFTSKTMRHRSSFKTAIRSLSDKGTLDVEYFANSNRIRRMVWKGNIKAHVPSDRNTREIINGNTLEVRAQQLIAEAREEGRRSAIAEYEQRIAELESNTASDLSDDVVSQLTEYSLLHFNGDIAPRAFADEVAPLLIEAFGVEV